MCCSHWLLQQHSFPARWKSRATAESNRNRAALLSPVGSFTPKIMPVAPALQAVVSYRRHDCGAAGEPDNTGYTRALIAPGVAFSHPDGWKLYADVEVPV